MEHFGDIKTLNGNEVPHVNVIIGGSPCTDLSVSGSRAGLSGAASGLFYEQIRLIREMREDDVRRGRTGKCIRPRFMVWENVPGAFSTNKGRDFGIVLHETVKIAQPKAPSIPMPNRGWSTTGCLVSVDGQWSVAWRVFDTQFYKGTPQRRRRISLIADFGGMSAPEILFERDSVSRHSEESGEERKDVTANTQCGSTEAGEYVGENKCTFCLQGNSIDRSENSGCCGKGWTEGVSYTLNTVDRPDVANIKFCIAGTSPNSEITDGRRYPTVRARGGTGGGNVPYVCMSKVYDARGNGDGFIAPTIVGDHENRITDYTGIVVKCIGNGEVNQLYEQDVVGALNCMHDEQCLMIDDMVRRLTPLECERLQGLPDNYTDIGEWLDSKGKIHKNCSDAARYRAVGNGIAVPPWTWILTRLSKYCDEDRTMASLFDGIGTFPLIWERINGSGTCLWGSEIDEFAIAVSKRHFPDNT